MNFIVKITTEDNILDMICPCFCRGCGKIGSILCECCKKNMVSKQNGSYFEEISDLPFDGLWCCGWRDELIGQLVEEFKFHSVRKMSGLLAEFLDYVVPELSSEVVIVPLPTIRRHIRERGMDHTLAVAKRLVRRKGYKVDKVLGRAQNKVQVGSDAAARKNQAKQAYKITREINSKKTYLLFDDVWTTGASMCEAAKLLRKNGAKKVYGAVLVKSRNKLLGNALDTGLNSTVVDADSIEHEVDNSES